MVFPISFLFIPIAVILSKTCDLANKFRPKFRCGMIIVLLIIILHTPKAVVSVHQISSSFVPEYDVAKFLEDFDPKSKTLIYPRPSKNIWGESLISAVIGNSMKLKIDQNIFSFDMLPEKYREDIDKLIEEKNIDYVISFRNGKYRFSNCM